MRTTTETSTRRETPAPPAGRVGLDARCRLLTFVACFERGGTEGQSIGLALSLDPTRFDLRFGCLRQRGPLAQDVAARGVPIREYPVASFYRPGYPRQVLRLARDLMRDRVRVVHSYGFYSHMIAIPAARLAGVPLIVASMRDRGVYLSRTQLRAQAAVCRLAHCVLANAEAVRDWLVEGGYDPARIRVIHNGVNLSRFPDPRTALRRPDGGIRCEFGLGPDDPVIAMVARMVPGKGYETLFEAAARLAPAHPHLRFLLVGGALDQGYRTSLLDEARRLGVFDRLLVAGDRADVPDLLREVTMAVLPSLNEAMPNAVLEGMAAGTPVVATRVGGVPEAIEDGLNGLLVDPGDAAGLAAAIAQVLGDPLLAARLGRAGRETIQQKFSVERMVRATEALYGDAAPGDRRREPARLAPETTRKIG